MRRLPAESIREVESTDTPSASCAKTLLRSVGAALSVTTTPVPPTFGEVNVPVGVPVAVAAAESVTVFVAALIAVIVVPAAMPVPVTVMPVCR